MVSRPFGSMWSSVRLATKSPIRSRTVGVLLIVLLAMYALPLAVVPLDGTFFP